MCNHQSSLHVSFQGCIKFRIPPPGKSTIKIWGEGEVIKDHKTIYNPVFFLPLLFWVSSFFLCTLFLCFPSNSESNSSPADAKMSSSVPGWTTSAWSMSAWESSLSLGGSTRSMYDCRSSSSLWRLWSWLSWGLLSWLGWLRCKGCWGRVWALLTTPWVCAVLYSIFLTVWLWFSSSSMFGATVPSS